MSDRLAIPYWFLNTDDFVRLFRASQGVQRPVPLEALRLARNESAVRDAATILRTDLVHELNRIWSLSSKDEKTSKDVRDLASGLLNRLDMEDVAGGWESLGLDKGTIIEAVTAVEQEAASHIDQNSRTGDTYPKVLPADARQRIQTAIDPTYGQLTGTALGGPARAGVISADSPVFFD
ncbi:MAG: ATPase, partial [Proteobacteria bacterium]|nr:ATPase [Pseudomonadota bacterium]